jgi:hypothetical protein
VPWNLAKRLEPHIGLAPGIEIGEAIEIVFAAQAQYLASDPTPSGPSNSSDSAPVAKASQCGRSSRDLSRAEALSLTERIRRGQQSVCALLLEAHDGKAATALGYASWAAYAREEFGLSRSRSYELLDQGRIALQLQLAAGTSTPPPLSAYAALQVKPFLTEVLREVKQRIADAGSVQAEGVVLEVVAKYRSSARTDVRYSGHGTGGMSRSAPAADKLPAILSMLTEMPPVDELVASMSDAVASDVRDRLPKVIDRLVELAGALSPRGVSAVPQLNVLAAVEVASLLSQQKAQVG